MTNMVKNRRIMLAGTSSNSGKSTITVAVLSALKQQGYRPTAFKVGPDYLDPAFHRSVLGINAYNLDSFFLTEQELKVSLMKRTEDMAVIEGVMGYYDGIGREGRASTYEVARFTESPVVLVIDAKGMYNSCAAVISGFKNYREDSNIRGVILNRVKKMTYLGLKEILSECGVQVLGYFPECEEAQFSSQYMGLILPQKHVLQQKIDDLGHLAQDTLDLEGLIQLSEEAPDLQGPLTLLPDKKPFSIAVAKDDAFCFMYQENLDVLTEVGANIEFFSPLQDEQISSEVDALYLPGGYPEQYAEQLSQNLTMLESIKFALEEGLPCIAEGGGFLYLHSELNGQPMVGRIQARAKLTEKIQGFGYHYLIPKADSLIGFKDKKIPSRRYHYCRSNSEGADYRIFRASSGKETASGYAQNNLFASFFSLYFPSIKKEMLHFREEALAYQAKKGRTT